MHDGLYEGRLHVLCLLGRHARLLLLSRAFDADQQRTACYSPGVSRPGIFFALVGLGVRLASVAEIKRNKLTA